MLSRQQKRKFLREAMLREMDPSLRRHLRRDMARTLANYASKLPTPSYSEDEPRPTGDPVVTMTTYKGV